MNHITSTRYDLEPYSFTGLSAPSLPPLAQKFLSPFVLMKHPSVDMAKTRLTLAQDLIDQLRALDTTILSKYYESIHFNTFLENIHEPYSLALIKAQLDEEKVRLENFNSLNAQRLSIIVAFSQEMDAAIWLESQMATRYGLCGTKDEEQAYRDAVVEPYLEYADHALPVLQSVYFLAMAKGNEHPTEDDIAKEMMPFVEEFMEKVKGTPARLGSNT